MSNLIFSKGSKEQKHLKKQVNAFLALQNIKSLTVACEQTGFDYQLIYGQLNGYRLLKVDVIEKFIKEIDKKKKIDLLNGLPSIVGIHG